MDNRYLNAECVRKLWSVSTKFSHKMRTINYCRPLELDILLFVEKVDFLLDETGGIYGSHGEGTMYLREIVKCRDVDIINIYPQTVAVEDAREKDQYDRETYVYLVDNNRCQPGYCLLRMLSDGSSPLLQLFHPYREIFGGKYILSSTCKAVLGLFIICRNAFTPWIIQLPEFTEGIVGERGPAINIAISGFELNSSFCSMGFNITKIDAVYVIYCPKWPSCASEWVQRQRPHGWPSRHQIRDIERKGIYLAPVGFKQSELEQIQWRYSFNEAEKILARSFNFTQVKCYVLLKMLISENVTPIFDDDVISSYHLKTLMFWTIEQTDPQLWVSRKLVELVFLVLNRLFMCVMKLYCPSYFLPDENLFAGKVTRENMEHVSQALLNIICEGWLALARLPHFATDRDFIQSLDQDNDIIYDEDDTIEQIIDPNIMVHLFTSPYMINKVLNLLNAAMYCNINEAGKMDAHFNEVINKLLQKISVSDDMRDKEILQNILAVIRCSYGTHFLSLSRCPSLETTDNRIMEELGLIYTKHSCTSKLVECLAKYANYSYITGDVQSVIAIAQQLLDRYANSPLHPHGVIRNTQASQHHIEQIIFNTMMNGMDIDDLFDNLCHVGYIVYLKNEIYALPDDARVEMFHVLGAESHFQAKCSFWFGLSPFLYVAYLAFLVNFDSGHQDTAEVYLRIMEIICSKPPSAYESSSLNLLGVSYVKMGQLDKAMKTFSISVKRSRCNNAAVWHVARLLWRKLRDRWNETS